MVWIHGVLSSQAPARYNGTPFVLRGDVIVVTINYRLGPLGFLHLSPYGEAYSSNTGLLDQIAALQWVRDHIAGFGGDPERVTVFGESAGDEHRGLTCNAGTKGLFHRAIMQSGASHGSGTGKDGNGWFA